MAHRNWARQIVVITAAALAVVVAVADPVLMTVGVTAMPGWLIVAFVLVFVVAAVAWAVRRFIAK